jgi:hypothetical protein
MTGSTKTLLLAGLIAAGTLFPAATANAHGGFVPPVVPDDLEVPSGHRAYLIVHAVGTQNQICLPRTYGTGLAWTLLGPQATAFSDRDEQVLTHFLSANPDEAGATRATWQSSRDSSAVWALALAASTDPEFVEAGAIPWLLLQVVGAESGPTGGDKLTATTYIQRVDTEGGIPPAGDCPALGAKLLVPYAADYVFYKRR